VDVVDLKQHYLAKPYTQPRALRVTFLLAVLYAVVIGVATLTSVGTDLASNSLEVSLPIQGIPLQLNPTLKLDGTTATFIGGPGFDHATLDVAGLAPDARLWLAAGHLAVGATFIAIGVTLALLCRRVGQGDPFSGLISRSLRITGAIVLVGGLAWQVCLQVSQRLVLAQAFGLTSGQWKNTVKGVTPDSAYWPAASNNLGIDFWPIGIGLALFALATVFRYGQKLEHERASLLEEVKGLV
jgi:TRAP-type C4-dicarboxylate transport system permease small subunit